jgi:uncharacterized membrane protein
MKPLLVSLSVLSLAILVGCDSGHSGTSNKVGGQGATASTDRGGSITDPILGLKDNTFKLTTPTLTTDIKQGEEKSIDIGIKRGKGFDQDVALTFETKDGKALPKEIHITPEKTTIKKGDDKTAIKVKADDDAPLNKFTIKVNGKPGSGDAASDTFDIEVKKK